MNQNQPTPSDTSYPPVESARRAIMRPVFRPYVTYAYIGICVLVFLLQFATSNNTNFDFTNSAVTNALDKNNGLILQGQVWRLFTPMFLHGGILHIASNMYALFIFGPGLEMYYRRGRYIVLLVLSGFAGNVMSFIFTAAPSLGASTAIFGLLGAEGVLIYQNREVFGSIARQALSQVIIIAVINLVIGFAPNSGIDYWGHIGGLIGGTLFAWFGGPLLRRQGAVQPYTIVNIRTNREVIVAGTAVFGLFFFLTLAVMFLRLA
jgi:rhomboid protease GluP